MRRIFVVSDTHFNHHNILKFTHSDADDRKIRGSKFATTEEMNDYMVHKWNEVVTDEDIVYHLGDVYFGPQKEADDILSRLKGSKRLILGNHDNGKDSVLHKHFQKILVWRVFKEFDCVLTHIPLHQTSINEKVTFNVHGHIHQNNSPSAVHINVSVEKTDYTPLLLEDVIRNHKSWLNEPGYC
jgi:calcineurin-like phosphoesterase family protein